MASTQTGDSTADQARDKAQQAGEQVKEKAQQAGEQAKGRVSNEVDRRSTEVGEQATSVADAMRQASQQLREQGKDQAAKPMEQAAQRVESAGQWLRDADGDQILGDVEDFGRRNPLAVAAGGLAIGFALSRLLKASSRDRYRSAGTRPTGDGNGRAGLPQRTTTAPRPGGLVPDLPEPDRPATGTGSPYGQTAGGGTRPDAPAPVPPVPGEASGAVTPGGAQRGGVAPGGGTGV
jgi:hypothetical protein